MTFELTRYGRCNKVAVGQLADPNSKIDMLFEKIDHAVGQNDLDVNFGIGLKEFRCYRENMQAAKDDRRGDDRSPLGALYSPDAARSASLTSSKMRLHAAT